jgi:N-acetylglucosaminyl-diphospho-decaprenol L-rhamnosyltransferase
VNDLAAVVVSTNEARWLRPCLSTLFAHLEGVDADVVVADNMSTDGTRELVEREFPTARVVTCENRGFSHANNRALLTTDARYVLFLNPDTEIVAGSFRTLIDELDARPRLGLVGVKQITADGQVFPTIRYAPNALRALGEALGSERLPPGARTWLGERELRMWLYEREVPCDWTSGSYMLARREALESAGYLDERFFIYFEETDLCIRIKVAGWQIVHLPSMTILHHAGKAGVSAKMLAQEAYTRKQYARKQLSPLHRAAYLGATGVGYALRALAANGAAKKAAARLALRTLVGIEGPPFGEPPPTALALRRPQA